MDCSFVSNTHRVNITAFAQQSLHRTWWSIISKWVRTFIFLFNYYKLLWNSFQMNRTHSNLFIGRICTYSWILTYHFMMKSFLRSSNSMRDNASLNTIVVMNHPTTLLLLHRTTFPAWTIQATNSTIAKITIRHCSLCTKSIQIRV